MKRYFEMNNTNINKIVGHCGKLFLAFAFLLFTFISYAQTTVSLQASADARIDASGYSTNYATEADVITMPWSSLYSRRFVIKFDLSSIPTGSTIQSATLKLLANFQNL